LHVRVIKHRANVRGVLGVQLDGARLPALGLDVLDVLHLNVRAFAEHVDKPGRVNVSGADERGRVHETLLDGRGRCSVRVERAIVEREIVERAIVERAIVERAIVERAEASGRK
jgi:hypothetical protein